MNANGYIAEQLAWARKCNEALDRGEVKSGSRNWDACIAGVVNGWQQVVLMEVVRLLNPDVADRLAADMREALDAGDSLGELLWEWTDHLSRDEPISEPARYPSIFDRVMPAATEVPS